MKVLLDTNIILEPEAFVEDARALLEAIAQQR